MKSIYRRTSKAMTRLNGCPSSVQAFLQTLDALYVTSGSAEVEGYLLEVLESATASGQNKLLQTALTEYSGYLRGAGRFAESVAAAKKVVGLFNRIPASPTSMGIAWINLATSCRLNAEYDEASKAYQKAEELLQNAARPPVEELAALNNNYALLLVEQGAYDRAEARLIRALKLLPRGHECLIRRGTTYSSLATVYRLGGKQEKAVLALEKALECNMAYAGSDDLEAVTDPHLFSVYAEIAQGELLAGRVSVGKRLYTKVHNRMMNCLGEDNPDVTRIAQILKQLENNK